MRKSLRGKGFVRYERSWYNRKHEVDEGLHQRDDYTGREVRARSFWFGFSFLIIFPLLGISAVFAEPSIVGLHEFAPARPGYVYAFPRDHGSHEQFQTEWWYFTGHLSSTNGRRFGYELTFFRRGIDSPDAWSNPSAWAMRHVYF